MEGWVTETEQALAALVRVVGARRAKQIVRKVQAEAANDKPATKEEIEQADKTAAKLIELEGAA